MDSIDAVAVIRVLTVVSYLDQWVPGSLIDASGLGKAGWEEL